MFKLRLLCIVFTGSVVMAICTSGTSMARQTVVKGSLGVGYAYWERNYDQEENIGNEDIGDRRDYFAIPEIELQSLGIHDSVSFRYAPVLRYDDLFYETEVDHYLSLDGKRDLSKNWNISLADDYVLSTDPARYTTPFAAAGAPEEGAPVESSAAQDEITQNLGRARYWTNDLRTNTSYVYAKDSEIRLGYGYRVLRNDSGNDEIGVRYNEYDRHRFSGFGSYKFNPAWRTSLELQYVKGLYEENPNVLLGDLEEYRTAFELDYDRNAKNIFPLRYRFSETDYDEMRPDIQAHEVSAGWEHTFDQRTTLGLGGGPAYVDSDELDGSWGYNFYFNLLRTHQYGNISLIADKRYEPRNFTGAEDSGLVDIFDIILDATYRFTPKLSSSMFVGYRHEEIMNPQGEYYISALGDADPLSEQDVDDVTYKRESYSIGGQVEYAFLSWLSASIRYRYYNQDGNLVRDSFEDHQVTVMLSATKELWRK